MAKKIVRRSRVSVGGITPLSAAEHRRLDGQIKAKYDWLRKRYKEISGKRVDWIDHHCEDGLLYVGVRFTDGTYFSLSFSPQIVTEGVEFSDMSTGDDVILKTYYRKRE